jgi:hypothetical protein
LEPRDVGRPDESVPAQEGNLCYQSSYQLMHSAIAVVCGTISCRQSVRRWAAFTIAIYETRA